jgi:dihydroneopterin aldolase/2-amino-4-hydroxy-6-hydroxymethyldihydropteridine diphosphokinase
VSGLWETEPVGGPDQPAYLNAVVLARTTREPKPLLRDLHAIEAKHGRTREVHWGARVLDLDLIQYGEPGTDSERLRASTVLTLPHPRAVERAFVLAPWVQADPEARVRTGHSGTDPVARVADLLAGLDTTGIRPGPRWSPAW